MSAVGGCEPVATVRTRFEWNKFRNVVNYNMERGFTKVKTGCLHWLCNTCNFIFVCSMVLERKQGGNFAKAREIIGENTVYGRAGRLENS